MKLIIALVPFLLSLQLIAETAYEKQVAFEEKITDQISHKLDKVLAAGSYKVIVNGELKLNRTRIKIEEQVDQQAKNIRAKKAEKTPALPGFNVGRADQEGNGDNRSESSKTKYRYVENFIVDSLDVYLIYGESIPEDRKELATTIVNKHLKSSFGDKANVVASTSQVDVPKGTAFERMGDWITTYLDKRGGSAIDLLYIFLIGILVLASVLGVWGYYWRKRRATLNMAKSASASSEAAGKAQHDLELARAEAKEAISFIVESLTKNTLVTQSFLRQLKYADKTTLVSYIHSPALNEYIMRVLGIEATFREDVSKLKESHSREKTERLKTIVEDLKHYQKLQDDFNTHRFGYLNLIDPKVLYNYFAGNEKMIDKLALAAKYLPKAVYLSITSQLSVAQKAKLFQRLNAGVPDSALLDDMEEELRQLFERQKREISCPTEEAQLQHLMLDNDLTADQLIREMQSQGLQLTEELKKYTVNMENIFEQEPAIIRRTMDELSNEVIAKAYAKSSSKYKLKDFMPENRFRLIDAMIARFHRIDDEQVKEAQLQILGTYRVNV